MPNAKKEKPAASSNVPSGPAGTLSKSVFALAIEPLTMALTVTGRKAYDVMLWLAQRSTPNADGGYTSPVSTILKSYGSTTKASERVQRYIEQMVQTTVVWRPLAASEGTMLLEGLEERPGRAMTDEARTFALLAEARLFMRGGEAWVTWYYPPSIREQLVNPERWAQIELNSIARLSSYTAVALYEICARYKDSPGGLTSRHDPDFWTRVLREGGGLKPREFRKFKNELLVPAMGEINEKTEIAVELVEHREQGQLAAVQFKVTRRPREKERVPEPADVTQALRAGKLGVREEDLDALTLRYGDLKVDEALSMLESYVENPNAARINNRLAYLKAILANKEPQDEQAAAAAGLALDQSPVVQDLLRHKEELVNAWRASRVRQLRAEFAELPQEEKVRWVDAAAPIVLGSVATPGIRRRLADKDWESPLISRVVLDVYGKGRYGNHWLEPSEMDLMMFSAGEGRTR